MKHRFFPGSLLALAALGGCNKSNGNAPENVPVKVSPAIPSPGGDWSNVVNQTSDGFMMGNPNAKVKLVEIASLGCPYCKRFEDEGVPALIDKYVKPGTINWEFRPYLIHGPVDMAANLIVSCNGARSFFPLVQAIYKDQSVWMAKIEGAPQDKLTQLQTLPTNQVFVAIANLAGLQDWAAARGVPQAKSNQCLSDQKAIDHQVQVTSDVGNQYPDFTGTPSFIVNGKLLPREKSAWDKLEPEIQDALK